MSGLTLFGLKNCDTCKKALKALDASGKQVTFRDIRDDGPSQSELQTWLAHVGRDKLLNTRSTTWRQLDDAVKDLPDDEAVLSLLMTNPTLIKRPVIVSENIVSVGWSKAEQAAFLE